MGTIILYTLAFLVFMSLWGFYWAIRPIRITSTVTPTSFNIPYEEISFYTKDNVLIRGWYIPSQKPKAKTIILLHGYPADKGNILPSRLFLHSDYNLLLFDFRYLGESGGHYSTVGKNEVLDLLAAINYLHTRGINEVYVWGFSLGGAVALMTATESPSIRAIVTESSYAKLEWLTYEYYRIPFLNYPLGYLTRLWAGIFLQYDINKVSPAEAAKKLSIPVLVIHSKRDNVISFRHGLLLKESFKNNSKAEFIVTDKAHGEPAEDYQQVVKGFFDRVKP